MEPERLNNERFNFEMSWFFTDILNEIVLFLCDIFYLVLCLFLLSSSLAKAPSSNLSRCLQRRHIKECFQYFLQNKPNKNYYLNYVPPNVEIFSFTTSSTFGSWKDVDSLSTLFLVDVHHFHCLFRYFLMAHR